MTSSQAPRPLVQDAQDASSRLRGALLQARVQGPSDAELQAMINGVTASLGAQSMAATASSSEPRTWPPVMMGTRWRPWIIGTSVALLAALGGWSLARRQAVEEHRARAPSVEATTKSAGSMERMQRMERMDQAAPAIAAPFEAPLIELAPQIAPEAVKVAQRARAQPRVEPVVASPAEPWLDDSAAENALLEPAVRDLRAQRFALVLDRASEHAQKFPNGGLSQAREMLAIEALIELERRPEALARAEQFRGAFPNSLYQQKLDLLLAER